jgi:DNA-binding MarR family transcriptional regulator
MTRRATASPAGSQVERAAGAAQAWTAMRTLVLELHDRRAAVSEALNLSFIRVKALTRLGAGPLTMRELAGQLGTDPPYTTVVVDDLERRGLVRRSTSQDDRRVKIVTITDAGARAAVIAGEILSEPPPVLAALDAGDLAELTRILNRLVADAQVPGGDRSARAAAAARPATRPEKMHPPRKVPSSDR